MDIEILQKVYYFISDCNPILAFNNIRLKITRTKLIQVLFTGINYRI
jgi:hypothetical protein